MKKQVLLIGSGGYGSLLRESVLSLNLDLTVADGRGLDIASFPGEYVIIATPNFTHFDLAARALQSGKHVLCEKPLAFTVKEVRNLYHIAVKNKRYLGVGFVLPHHPYYLAVKEKQVEYGPIRIIRVYNHATEGELKPEWYWNIKESGGWFMVAEIHWYHLFLWLTGSHKVKIVQAKEEKKADRTVATWSVIKTDQNQQLFLDHRLDMNQQNHWTKVEIVYENDAQVILDDWVPQSIILPNDKGKKNEYDIQNWRAGRRLATYQELIRINVEQLLGGVPIKIPQEILLAHKAAETAQEIAL